MGIMSEDEFTPARKRQFIIAACMMLLVIVLALIVAFNGEALFE